MSNEVRNTAIGGLTGLALGLLARKLVAGDSKVDWSDYATWGGIGAGVGGLTGYGLTGLDTSKEDPEVIKEQLQEQEAEIEKLKNENAEVPGLLQAMNFRDYVIPGAMHIGLPAAVHAMNKALRTRYDKLLKGLNLNSTANTAHVLAAIKGDKTYNSAFNRGQAKLKWLRGHRGVTWIPHLLAQGAALWLDKAVLGSNKDFMTWWKTPGAGLYNSDFETLKEAEKNAEQLRKQLR